MISSPFRPFDTMLSELFVTLVSIGTGINLWSLATYTIFMLSFEKIAADGTTSVSFTSFMIILQDAPNPGFILESQLSTLIITCLLYTSDAADEEDSVDLGG